MDWTSYVAARPVVKTGPFREDVAAEEYVKLLRKLGELAMDAQDCARRVGAARVGTETEVTDSFVAVCEAIAENHRMALKEAPVDF
jgi:hypothetical protein